MKFTIVTISFNQAKFLRRAIDSILAQGDEVELEYIVVDPGSGDGSREIIHSYGERIEPLLMPDDGPADGLRNGFERATGDILGFINADDYLLPGSLAAVAAFFERAGNDCFVSGSGWFEYEDGGRRPIQPTRMTPTRALVGASTVFQQGTFFPRALYEAVGGINPRNTTCWDWELFLDFVLAGHPHHLLDRELAVFSIHDQSISGSGRLIDAYRAESAEIFRRHTGRDYRWTDTVKKYLFLLERDIKRLLQP